MRLTQSEQRVLAWYQEHPFGTSAECAAELDLVPTSVRRIKASIRRKLAEPEPEPPRTLAAMAAQSRFELTHTCTCGNVHPAPALVL